MAYLQGFGGYVPERVVWNDEIAHRIGRSAEWIVEMSGIHERRWAEPTVGVVELAVRAAEDCLTWSSVPASSIGMLIVASGSSERRFPGPAAVVGHRLGLAGGVPCLDVPMASAGGLFAMSMASRLVSSYGFILVVASEKMSAVIEREPMDPNTAMLFGDGAGACLVSSDAGRLRIVDSELHSDGAFAEDLRLGFDGPLEMNGMSVIMQAGRKIPAAILSVLARNSVAAGSVERFVMHQANQNLILRVAKTVGVPAERFYTNIARYGNTSSASMLIAASESLVDLPQSVCFAAFGAGYHWGALLAVAG